MLVIAISTITVLFIATILFDLIRSFVDTWHAIKTFRETSNGMPIAEHLKINGHLDLIFAGSNWKYLNEQHEKLGKFCAVFYTKRILVSTIDLDFIKSMIFDEPQHTNRIDSYDLFIDEMSSESIMLARDDKWRRLRKCIAPAFS